MPGRVSLAYRRPAARAALTGSIAGMLVCRSGILLLIKGEAAKLMPTLTKARAVADEALAPEQGFAMKSGAGESRLA